MTLLVGLIGLVVASGPVAAASVAVAAPLTAAVDTAEPSPLLPWPPPLFGPWMPTPPPGTPPFLPPLGPAGSDWWPVTPASPPPGNLASLIPALQQALDLLGQWAGIVQQATSVALTHMIGESPGYLPGGASPDLIDQITQLPVALRGTLDALAAKLQARVLPGSLDARHQAYIESSSPLTHEAAGITAADEIITRGAVQQDAAAQATTAAASAAAHDSGLPAAISAGHETGDRLLLSARNLPSTRSGIELVVAGMGMGMRQQADLGAAVAGRLTLLAQQTAQVSRQIGALAATTGTLVARDAERDRQTLDARLGVADALGAGGQMLRQMLGSAGESGDEIRIDPLYH